MTGLAAAAAFVAAWLGLTPRPGLRRLDEVRQPNSRAAPPWWVVLAALAGAVGGTWLGGWALGVGLALVTATAAWVLRRNRRRRSAAKAELEVVRSCQLLAGLLRAKGGADKLLIVGGVIPEEDQAVLREAGVARIFTMGADTREIVAYLNEWRATRDAAGAC